MSTFVVKNIDRADKQTNNILAPSANTTLPPWFKTTTDYNAQIENVCLLADPEHFCPGVTLQIGPLFFDHLLRRPLHWISDHLI